MNDDRSQNGLPPPHVAWGIIAAVALALGGWTYLTSSRVAALETKSDANQRSVDTLRADLLQQLHDLRDDVRDLRNKLLGPVAPGGPRAP